MQPETHNRPDASDEQLVHAIGMGDRDALGELVRRYQEKLRRVAFRTLGDVHAADDAVQDTFVRVFGAARRFKPTGKASSWLYRITLNLCKDRLRKLKRRAISLDALGGQVAAGEKADPMETDETIRQVNIALDALPDRQRTSVLLHRYEGMSHRRIAEITGWSQSAVESLLIRAYANLRKNLADLISK